MSKTIFVQGVEAEIIISNVNGEVFIYQDDKEILHVDALEGDKVVLSCPPDTNTNIHFELRSKVGGPYQALIEIYVGDNIPAYRASLNGTSHPKLIVWKDHVILVKRGSSQVTSEGQSIVSERTSYNENLETFTTEIPSKSERKKITQPKK